MKILILKGVPIWYPLKGRKMKRRLLFPLVILFVLAVFLVSCNPEAGNVSGNENLADLKLTIINVSKAINTDSTYTAGMTVSSYEYKAICSSTPGAQGTQSTWAALTVVGNTASLEGFSRGTWTIDVRAKNANGGVFAQGSTGSFNLTPANAGSLSVVLDSNVTAFNAGNSAANVTVSVGVTVPTLAAGSISVRYTALADVSDFTASGSGGNSVSMSSAAGYSTAISGSVITHDTTSEGYTAYYGTMSLSPGLYALQVLYKDDGNVISGQTMAFRVVELAPFAINGILTSGEMIDLTFSSIAVNDGFITIEWNTEPAGDTENPLMASVTASATTGVLAVTSYKWYLDGVYVTGQTTASFTTTNAVTAKGIHTLTCIVSGTIGGIESTGFITGEVAIYDLVEHNVGGTIFYIDESAPGMYIFKNTLGQRVDPPSVGDDCTGWTYKVIGETKDKYYVYNDNYQSDCRWTYYDNGSAVSESLEGMSDNVGRGRRNTEIVMAAHDGAYVTADSNGKATIWYKLQQMNDSLSGGCDDWYVPSKLEVEKLREAITFVVLTTSDDPVLLPAGPVTGGSIASDIDGLVHYVDYSGTRTCYPSNTTFLRRTFWSSSQSSAGNANAWKNDRQAWTGNSKSNSAYFFAIRSF